MNILLAGYGFYVLGNNKLEGGTILPSLINWSNLSCNNKINLTCVVRTEDSLKIANQRFYDFFNKYKIDLNLNLVVKKYEEISELTKFDCGIISIPERSHLDCLKFMVRMTKNIICVKPFTLNTDQYLESLEIAKTENVNIFIDFHKRYDETNIEFIRQASLNLNNKGIFNFSYGQKTEMPFFYFKKWANSSNPFQYLAPHYLDIIFQILKNKGVNYTNLKISGTANALKFKNNLISLISCNLKLSDDQNCFLLNSICNWMEPKMSPFNSRQRIEYQTESMHLISEQDNRGQMIINDDLLKIPNPHFMTQDLENNSYGYGVKSFTNFLDYVSERFPKDKLSSIDDYLPIAKIIDYVNELLN